MQRICIHTKDIMIITGKSERHARNLLQKIKEAYNKLPHQLVTFNELCHYLGINKEEIKPLK